MLSNPYKTFFLLANILFIVICWILWHFTRINPVVIYMISISLITFLFSMVMINIRQNITVKEFLN